MSIIVNQSLFPVVALHLGTTETQDIKDKKVYKLEKNYFAVFCIKTPNRVYFLDGGENVTVPRLSELLKTPNLTIGEINFDISLPANVINTFVKFLSDPTVELSGFRLYDLYSQGFITADIFASSILGMIKPLLSANGVEVNSINSNELIILAHKAQATKLGLSGDNLSLTDRLKAFVNHDNKALPMVELKKQSNAVDVTSVEIKDQPTLTNTVDIESETIAETLTSIDQDVSDNVEVNLSTINKKDLLAYSKKLGLTGLSKCTVKQIRDAVEEKLTIPETEKELATV